MTSEKMADATRQDRRDRRWSWVSEEDDETKEDPGVANVTERSRLVNTERRSSSSSLASRLLKPVSPTAKKLPVADDIKLAGTLYALSGGSVEAFRKTSRKAKKHRGGSAGDIEIPSDVLLQHNINLRPSKRKPLRKTASLQISVEDDTTSHPHEVIVPKPSVFVKTIEADAVKRDKWYAWIYLLLLLLTSCTYFHFFQGLGYIDATYFAIVTISSVGYGDIVPTDSASQLFAIVLFFVGAGVVGNLVAVTLTEFVQEAKLEETKVKHDVRRAEDRRRSTSLRRGLTEENVVVSEGDDDAKLSKSTSIEKEEEEEKETKLLAERIAHRRALKNPWRRLKRSLIQLLGWTLGGALWFYLLEPEVSILQAVYWSTQTLTSTGYGDIRPSRQATKLLAIFFILGGTSICIRTLGSIAAIPIEAHKLQAEERVLAQYGDRLTQEDFLELTRGELMKSLKGIEDGSLGTNAGRKCTKAQFTLAHLVKLGKIEIDDVHECFLYFDRLDKHHHGYICVEDVLQCTAMKDSAKPRRKLKNGKLSPNRRDPDSPHMKFRPNSEPTAGTPLLPMDEISPTSLKTRSPSSTSATSSYELTDEASSDNDIDSQQQECNLSDDTVRTLASRTVPKRSVTYGGEISTSTTNTVRERWRRASRKLNTASKLRRTSLYRPKSSDMAEPTPRNSECDPADSGGSNSNILSLLT